METLARDLRFALRRLAQKPAFTAIAILSLAIGIGANTAIFSLINAIILRDLPLQRPEELVDVYQSVAGFSHGPFSFPDIEDLRREASDAFLGVAASRLAFVQTDVENGVEIVTGEIVSGNYFTLLGVPAHIGRTLLPEDDISPRGHAQVMLSYQYWQERYEGDRTIVGQGIRLNGLEYTIVGVAPRSYTGNIRGLAPAIYAPSMMVGHLQPSDQDELQFRGNQSVFAKARLVAGVTPERAQEVCDRVAESLRSRYPENWQADNVITVVPTAEVIMNPMIDHVLVPAAALMMVVVALVLLIACANLASFLLAQAADRRKEVAVRLALGAGRLALIRQFLTESVLLAIAGGGAGLLLARLLLQGLVRADLPLPFPITLDLRLDPTVLGFSFLVTVAAGLLFGMAPAIQATRAEVAPTLKDESTGGGRPRRLSLRSGLVVVQVAVSLMLLVGAGLFLRSLQARLDIDPGFGHDPAAILMVQAVPDRYTPTEGRVFFGSLLDQIRALPGVEAVGMTDDVPLSTMNNLSIGLVVDGVDPPPDRDDHEVDRAEVDAGFFDAVGVPLLQGRAFNDGDAPGGAPVAIVSAAFVERFWPGGDAVGRTFHTGDAEYTVVGVARDVKVRSLGEAPRPFVYLAFSQAYSSSMTLIARTSGEAAATLSEMLALARRLDPELLIYQAETMDRHLGVMLLPHRLSALVVSAFGGLALLLASIGLYGVVSYSVSTRSREVGIRMALGADPASVVRMLMSGGLRLAAIGAVIGFVLSLAAGRLLGGLLYGVAATDPIALGVVPLVLGVVAVLAVWLPARRASGVKPVKALRAT